MCLIQVFSGFVLYDAAFTTIVQSGIGGSQNMIMFLTLLAGFASTISWPATSALDSMIGWRWTFVFFAALNLCVCFPVHYWVSRRFGRPGKPVHVPHAVPVIDEHAASHKALDAKTSRRLMIMVTAGFAISGVTLSAVLSQMVPMLKALGMGSMSLLVSTLFGPSQVAMRGIQIFFGKYSTPLAMTIVALVFLPLGLLILAVTAPSLTGAIMFAVLVGLASGLKSIVQGTLPLAVFGRKGYGSRIGIMSGVRYVAAALAPFAFSWLSEMTSTRISAYLFVAAGVIGLLCFIDVILVMRRTARV
jgi:MFS family permease